MSILGLLLAFLGALTPLFAAFFPKLGIEFLRRMGKVNPVRQVLGLGGLALALLNVKKRPSLPHYLLLLPTGWMAALSQFLEARRIFVALVNPPHSPAPLADLGGQATVLGAVIDGRPHAWAYANLVPRHLINDVIGQIPVLAAY